MTQLCRKIVKVNFRWRLSDKVKVVRRFFKLLWHRILACSAWPPASPRYKRFSSRRNSSPSTMAAALEFPGTTSCSGGDSDLVCLKISLLGDCQIGKTSFAIRYVGDLQEQRSLQMKGLNLMDKTFDIGGGARIACKLWDVGGDKKSLDQVPIACKDAVAILFMFDLTSRCTLNSIIGWYSEARRWNKTAIPILVGTKFDDFVQMPPDIQWTVITQARAYAKATKATLFFSSSTHNINVNKIFKFIMAKLFNLPWTLERNLTIGEPIIDY
ncbi:septum-promoting GTP-binding protein 1-like [Primulina huaijiensis]|uniref:septum-promoting GTP-binding protein 1-like n=1 Tax=Primulina huaijiensis TaxID=1492673 RepID=UPI003CC6F2DF